ncbi:hypothetical protein HZC53_06115 [Candidatus Uhrbacteria bacterium]|nr:hypothetical protein [Candidatus Uhrbacteria bacterium]
MDIFLKYKLRRMGKKAEPEKAFVADLQRKIEAELGPGRIRLAAWKLAAVPALVIVMAVGGTGAYAYASDDVLPGNLLYPVRQGLEKVEEKLVIRQQAKLFVAVKHLERRLNEDKVMLNRQMNLREARLKDFKDKYQDIEGRVKKIPEGQRSDLEKALSNVSKRSKILEADFSKTEKQPEKR